MKKSFATINEYLKYNFKNKLVDKCLTLIDSKNRTISISYKNVLESSNSWQVFLKRKGLSQGDRVVVIFPHSVELYFSYIGALMGGFVPAMYAHPSVKISEHDYFESTKALIKSLDPKAILTYPELKDKLSFLNKDILIATADDVEEEKINEKISFTGCSSADEIAFYQYSSGTTGLKKGIAITHRALIWQIDNYAKCIGLSDSDKIVSWLPLYHDMGLIACFFMFLLKATKLVAMSPFDWIANPVMWVEAVDKYTGTLSWFPNFAYNFMVKNCPKEKIQNYSLASMRGLVNCAEPILAHSEKIFAEHFASVGFKKESLAASYAMAENVFAVTSAGFGEMRKTERIDAELFAKKSIAMTIAKDSKVKYCEFVSSGKVLPGIDLHIVDTNRNKLSDRHVGEIAFRAPCMFKEYYKNFDATTKSLVSGIYYSGDIGYKAEGQVFVTGRKKDLIIIGGQNIYPQDIEALVDRINGVVPGRSVAFGISNKNIGTEDLVILVETREQESTKRNNIRKDIFEIVGSKTVVRPKDVMVLDHMSLKKSTSGKISRKANRELYLQIVNCDAKNKFEKRNLSSEINVESKILQIVLEILKTGSAYTDEKIDFNQPLISSGLIDSFNIVVLINSLEREFGIKLDPKIYSNLDKFDTIANISDLIRYITNNRAVPLKIYNNLRCSIESPDEVKMHVNSSTDFVKKKINFWTLFYRIKLRLMGVKIGKNLIVKGPLILRVDGEAQNIVIGDNVVLMPYVDLKNREDGKIIINNNVTLDSFVRLVAANNARIELGCNVKIGVGTVVNAGEDVLIGRNSLFAGYCTINASDHKFLSGSPIAEQGFRHAPIYIGEDVWVGANAYIGLGARVGKGAIVGTQAVINSIAPDNSVMIGNPAKFVKLRTSQVNYE